MSQTQSQRQSSRHWPLDLMRILATYGVVLMHTSPLPAEYQLADHPAWRASMALSILFRWCVPVFFMVSGALFLNPKRSFSVRKLYRKNILRIATCFVFWSAFYALAHCAIMGKGKWTFLNQLLRGHYHMWYIFAILALYMLLPMLRKMTESRKLTEYFLGLGFLFVFLLPRLISFALMLNPPHADVVASIQSAVRQVNPLSGANSVFYFVLGYYLQAYPLKKAVRIPLWLAGAAGYLATVVLTIWHTGLTQSVSGQFYGPDSTTVLAMSVAVFLLFEHAFARYQPGARMQRLLLTLSECSFGVYLVHPFLIERLGPVFEPVPAVMVLGTVGVALGVYLVSLAISFLIHKIPFLNRYIV